MPRLVSFQAHSYWLGWSGYNLTTFIIIIIYNMIGFSCNITNKVNDFVLIYLLKRKVAFALCIGITVSP